MAVIIVISTGDIKIRWIVLSLPLKEKESGRWPLKLGDFHLISNDCIQHSGKIFTCNT